MELLQRKSLTEKNSHLSLNVHQEVEEKCLSFIAESDPNKVLCLGNAFSKCSFAVLANHFPERVVFSESLSPKSNGYSYEGIICYQSKWSRDITTSIIRLLEDSLSEGGTFILIYENDNNNTALKKFRQQVSERGFKCESACLDDPKSSQSSSSKSTNCIITVEKPFADEMLQIVNQYENEKLEKYEYIRQMHHINRSLFSLASRLPKTDLKKIEITDNDLLFTTRAESLKFHFSGVDRRAAPFEILNFGVYEAEEQQLLRKLTKNAQVIFDLGANIGWYTIWFAKNMPNSTVYAFEPISETIWLFTEKHS